MSETPKTCATCRFFKGHGDLMRAQIEIAHHVLAEDGYCRRFPHRVGKEKDDWCGEHQPKDSQ